MSESRNLEAAQDVHHKFEFYLLALTFTIAGFAIQTGKFSGNILGDFLEVSSWVILSISGVVGLWRIEYLPVAYRTYTYIQVRKQNIEYYKDEEEHNDSVDALRQEVAEHEFKLKEIEDTNRKKYRWQKIFFVSGLAALLLARLITQIVVPWCSR
ncbi:MAG: hypothetical protein HY096_15625 [Nitrospinae bacterium]|nr:hypothetical protein [Nitrospinota bacterium]